MAEPITASIMLALNALGAGQSIGAGVTSKKQARDAQRAAKQATADAKKQLEINAYEGLSLPTESFELASRGVTAGQMQATSALQEAGGRALLGGIGRIQAAGIQGQEAQRQMMEKAIMDREKLIADAQAKIQQDLGSMSMAQAYGAQEAAREKALIGNMQLASGLKTLGSGIDGYLDDSALFKKQKGLDVPPIDMSATNQFEQTVDMAAQSRDAFIGDFNKSVLDEIQGMQYYNPSVIELPNAFLQSQIKAPVYGLTAPSEYMVAPNIPQ
jgi:hypothetical protein